MKRRFILSFFGLFFFCFPFFLNAQVVDTAAVRREVDSLIQLNRSLTGQGKYEEALHVIVAAEKQVVGVFGKKKALYANCLFNHGVTFYLLNRYTDAKPLYLEAKTIQEKVLGKEHPDYAKTLNNIAILYYIMGQYEKAELFYLETKTIREKVLGNEHPDYAKTLSNISVLYKDMGKYENAESFSLEAKSIRGKVLGMNHPDYAASLNNLAILYCDMGKYESAETLYLEALSIYEKVLGKEDPDYAQSLNNLAILYWHMGEYDKAESFYLEAISINEKVLGKEHPDYASSLNNIAILLWDMGNFEKAESYYLYVKAIREKVLSKEHPDYAASLHNLAILYEDMGMYEKSELLCLEAKDIREKVLGKEHQDYAKSLNGLANIYKRIGKYDKAESLYIEEKSIWGKVLGKESPDYASSLNNLAFLYMKIGRYEKSELLYLESKTIRANILSKEHPDYAQSLSNLANFYWVTHNYQKSMGLYEELTQLNRYLINKASNHLSAQELNNYALRFLKNQDEMYSLAEIAPVQALQMAGLNYNNILFHKGFLLNAANQTRRLALRDSVSTEKYYTLKGYHRRLAAQYAQPIAERDSVLVAELEEKANTLEKGLVRTVAGYGEAMRQVNWQNVRDSLKKSEAAIEFVHYRYYDQKARATDSTMYAALMLLPAEASAKAGGDTAPHFIPLCEARQLEAIINRPKQTPDLYYQNIYSVDVEGKAPLYQALWAPLEPFLKDVTTIYYAPSGLLHRLNLNAIQPALRETLGDRFHLVELGSTRSLVVPAGYQAAANDAALFGGIRYEMDSTKIVQANIDLATDLATRGSNGFVYTDSTLRGACLRSSGGQGDWKYLPATEKEITVTDSILQKHGFQTTVRHDYAATEEALLSIGQGKTSPRVLHIATHGFFFPDPKDTLKSRQRLSGEEPVFKISDNPMIRSGLLLAGANHAWKTGKPLRPDMEDGILTAYEISQMNLRNTELVVLSACETGLGQIEGNEGVYGLQRAFKIAGAKYLLMSLWQVPDKATQELMEAFYENWLDGGKSIPDAFREAQVKMRAKYPNPFYWAGFVLVE